MPPGRNCDHLSDVEDKVTVNRIKKFAATILVIGFALSSIGCKKNIQYVEPDQVITALEDVFEIEEVAENEMSGYHVNGSADGKCRSIYGGVEQGSGRITFTYKIYNDPADAKSYFIGLYDGYWDNVDPDQYVGYFTFLEQGYLVVDEGDFYLGIYRVDDMVMHVDAHSYEQVDAAKVFLAELGLPTE